MNLKLFILLVLLTSTTIVAKVDKVDKDLSLEVELKNDTLDLSDPNLTKSHDDSRYYFWAKAIITNESMSPKKIIIWTCSGFGIEVESDFVCNAVPCRSNFPYTILLQPKESYKMRLYLSLRKDYTGDTVKFRIRYPMGAIDWSKVPTIHYPMGTIDWSDFFTMKLVR